MVGFGSTYCDPGWNMLVLEPHVYHPDFEEHLHARVRITLNPTVELTEFSLYGLSFGSSS